VRNTGANHGTDASADGSGTVSERRLYQLIRQTGTVTDQTFEIEFLDAGAEAFLSRSVNRKSASPLSYAALSSFDMALPDSRIRFYRGTSSFGRFRPWQCFKRFELARSTGSDQDDAAVGTRAAG